MSANFASTNGLQPPSAAYPSASPTAAPIIVHGSFAVPYGATPSTRFQPPFATGHHTTPAIVEHGSFAVSYSARPSNNGRKEEEEEVDGGGNLHLQICRSLLLHFNGDSNLQKIGLHHDQASVGI
ncbi:hypothetical protein PG987_007986 [Apiospora arundinis]